MDFGLFSNGFRPHTSAQQTYAEDIREIVLAERLGFSVVYISEHHGEAPYINRVDTIPVPELMMCKAAALTTRIRMGAAVKLIHLHHPLDVAIQAAATDHMVGDGRFIFGFGSGFAQPLFAHERGLSFEDRHARLRESLDFILKCWSEDAPFDWHGEHWRAEGAVALPKPLNRPHMPMATATESEPMIKLAGERGYTLLCSYHEPPHMMRAKAAKYAAAARAAGWAHPLRHITASRMVYLADSRAQAIEDLRESVAYEVAIRGERGFLKMLKSLFGVDVPADHRAIDALAEGDFYLLGEPDDVAAKLEAFWHGAGGFGTLLIVGGKDWATRQKRERSMRLFMEEVAPRLRGLDPADAPGEPAGAPPKRGAAAHAERRTTARSDRASA